MTEIPAATTVRFGRLERRGLLLGLSTAQTTALGVAVLVAVVAEYAVGAVGILVAAPLWVVPAAAALVPIAGRPALSWLPTVGHWRLRRALAQHRYLVRVDDLTTSGVTVPGLPTRLAVVEAPQTGAALIHDPHSSTITAVLSLSGSGFVLAAASDQDRRVSGWGRLLAGMCQQPSAVRLQVVERCVPGGAAPVRRWWTENALAEASWAARVLAELVADADQVSRHRETFLALAIRAPGFRKKATTPASLALAEKQLTALAEAARTADLDVHGWVTRRQLQTLLQTTYDPRSIARADSGDPPGGRSSAVLVGPAAVEEAWASVRTDSAHHAVYWVAEWPRSDVHAGFLQPLLLAPGIHLALSLTAEPLPQLKAMREIRRAKVGHAADSAQRARIGQLEDEATRAEVADVVRREQELVAGHGDLRFVGMLTVSAATPDELDAACVATETAAAQAMCEIRRLVGQQGQAFAAAALPLARRLS